MRKKIISVILIVAMVLGVIPIHTNAAIDINESEDATIEGELIEDKEIAVNTQSRVDGFSKNYTLTGNGATDMVAIALAQEGRTGSNFGYTEEWCADFVSDCAILAGQGAAVPQYGGVAGLYNRILSAGGTVTTSSPKPGDICFIDWNGGSSMGHVEIVYSVSGTTVYTIGGNSGSGSSLYTRNVKKHAPLSSGYVVAIVRPAYKGVIVSDEITISGQNAPGTLSVGNVFSITGTVSSGKALTDVTVGVYSYYGEGMETGKSVSPNSTSYNLKGLDPYVYFNHLEAGIYFYRVTASNSSKTVRLVNQPFIVLGNSRTIEDGNYQLASAASYAYLVGVAGNSNSVGANVQLERSDDSPYQTFEVIYVGNGYYNLRNKGSGLYLDVNGAEAKNGANVQLYEKNGSAAQNWQILPVGSEYCLVPQCATSYCLDITDAQIYSGTNIQIWSVDPGLSQRIDFIKGAVDTYEVFFDANGGNGAPSSQTVRKNSEITLPSTIPTRFGWNFKGWRTSFSATDTVYQPGDTYTVYESVTFYAVWECEGAYLAKEEHKDTTINYPGSGVYYEIDILTTTLYRVRSSGLYDTKAYLYDSNGRMLAENDDGGSDFNFELTYQLEAGKTYYIYVELYDSSAVGTFKTDIYQGYEIIYDTNGGKETFANEYFYTYYRDYELDEWSNVTPPTRDGYTFVEWNTAKDGSGVVFDPENPNTNWYAYLWHTVEITLYAIWEKDIQEVTVSYNANGGSGAPVAQKTIVGSEVTLSSTLPIRSGYKFIGWSPSATATVANYQPGETYTVEGNLTLYAIWIKTGTSNAPFSDVSNNAWYASAVQYVYENGIMSGSNGLFNPTGNITRAQVVATLYKLEGSPKVTDYRAIGEMVDVEAGQWYTNAVCWAYSVGVANGNSVTKKFNLNDPVTRQQLATFFYNYAKYKGLDTTTRGDISGMAGADQVADYALDTVKWAVGTGLITGSETTVNGVTVKDLKPTGTATRAQVASIIMKFCQKNGL